MILQPIFFYPGNGCPTIWVFDFSVQDDRQTGRQKRNASKIFQILFVGVNVPGDEGAVGVDHGLLRQDGNGTLLLLLLLGAGGHHCQRHGDEHELQHNTLDILHAR